MRGARRITAAVLLAVAFAGCALKRMELPDGNGMPFPDGEAAYDAAVKSCRDVRTVQLTLHLSGTAGGTRLRGSVDAGFEAPDRLRLEGRHPLGRPVFILVSSGTDTTLLMPRDNRVLRDVAPTAIVEALVGLPLGPGDLRALVSGCGFGAGAPVNGRQFSNDVAAVDVGDSTLYLRQERGQWRVLAAARPPLRVFYTAFAGDLPQTMRLAAASPAQTDLTVRLEDVNVNVPLASRVFDVEVPASAQRLTLDELRRAGPLGGE